jgi:hypothetical protein
MSKRDTFIGLALGGTKIAAAVDVVTGAMQGQTTTIGALAEHDLNRITPETILQAAEAGDEVTSEILEAPATLGPVAGIVGAAIWAARRLAE